MHRTHRRILTATLALTVGAAFLTGCSGKYSEPFKDAPRGTTNSGRADTVTMPDGFSNIATKCDHGNRLYAAYHGDSHYASIAVVPQDPTCAR